jgi:hypothetical protein
MENIEILYLWMLLLWVCILVWFYKPKKESYCPKVFKENLHEWTLEEKEKLKTYEVIGDTYYLSRGDVVEGLQYTNQTTQKNWKRLNKQYIKVLLPKGMFFSTKASNFKQI